MIKGKVGEISEDPLTKDLIVQVENQVNRGNHEGKG